MTMTQSEFRRLWRTLVWRGVAMIVLGTAAAAWPEQMLVDALLAVGLLSTVTGLMEISIGVTIRARGGHWLVLVHGIALVAFGALTAGCAAVPLVVALAMIATWLLFYTGLCWTAAVLVGGVPVARRALTAWGAVHVGFALLAVAYPQATILGLLFFGALYAALFGVWQVAVGTWLRRTLTTPPGELAARGTPARERLAVERSA